MFKQCLTFLIGIMTLILLVTDANAVCSSPNSMTGVWKADDGGTYYVRQIGNDVWWAGMSADDGKTWTNVFLGKRTGNSVTGTWGDVPRGRGMNAGGLNLQLETNDGVHIHGWKKVNSPSGVAGHHWFQPCPDTN